VKLINNILHVEIKLLTQSSYEVSNDINSWTIAKPSRSTTTRPSKTTHTSPGLANANYMQPSRLRLKNNNRNGKSRLWKKPSKQSELPSTQQLDNPNLLNSKKNEDVSCPIPTIINGVMSVNPKPKHLHEDSAPTSDSITHLISNLSDSINLLNKSKRLFFGKHKIVLIGDSHIRGYVNTLKPLLSSDYNLYCVVKPGSGTGELMA